MGKFGHSKFTSQQMFPIGNDKPWKRQPLTKDCGSNFSTLDRHIDSQFARHFVPMSRIHWRYIFLHMYSGMSGDHLVSIDRLRDWDEWAFIDTSSQRTTWQFGRTRKTGKPAPPRPRLSACVTKTLLFLPKFHSCFSIYTVIRGKRFLFHKQNTWFK